MKIKKHIILMGIICACLFAGCAALDKKETPPQQAAQNESSSPDKEGENLVVSAENIKTETAPAKTTGVESPVQINAESSLETIGDNEPLSRALAAKMAVLALNDRYSVESLEREITYADCDEGAWYDKYVNAAFIQGIMTGEGGLFRPDDNITIIEAQNILNIINSESSVKMRITDENRDKSISYALWVQLYEKCIDELEGENISGGINKKSMIVLADNSNNSKLPEGNIIADSGPFTAFGLKLGDYVDRRINVIERDGEIIALKNAENAAPRFSGAYIAGWEDGKLTIFLGGAERTYEYTGDTIEKGSICDFTLQNGKAESVNVYKDSFKDTVKLHNGEHIEFADRGVLPLSEDFRVYSEGSAVMWRRSRNIIIGSDTVRFFTSEGKISAAVIESVAKPEKIRVAIKDTSFEKFDHERVEITGTGQFKIRIEGMETTYEAGDRYVLENPEHVKDRVYIEPISGRLVMESIKRGYGVPAYRGSLEIIAKDGAFLIVNEVGFEEYLYSVVPSEMPVSYGAEALKVQAVTARSYAYNQFFANGFSEYGANVCDSVISQVYNNVNETESSIKAVNDTEGICLTYDGSVISANFFSTSAGIMANNGEVWADNSTRKFPANTSPYLVSKIQQEGSDYGNLSIEENMAAFIKNNNIKSYDNFSNWFRWYVEMTNEELTASINANLKERYEASPRLIKTLQSDGVFRSRPVESIGRLINIEVIKRGEGGNIMTLKITGEENTILVSTEYNIRTLIRPRRYGEGGKAIEIKLADGGIRTDYGLMPSAFFTMERMTDASGEIQYVKFYGGGNGHGVGMSQTGVKGMVDAGKTFDEILEHFYPGTAAEKQW